MKWSNDFSNINNFYLNVVLILELCLINKYILIIIPKLISYKAASFFILAGRFFKQVSLINAVFILYVM